MKFKKIEKIQIMGKNDVYHLTVQKNHNFFGNGICLHNCGYRGEIKVILANFGSSDFLVNPGDRIAQAIVCPVYGEGNLNFVKSEKLTETKRNIDGFGSTGKT